jgi:O-antigen ligase
LERNFIITLSLLSSLIAIFIVKDGWFYTQEPFNYLRTASGLFYLSLLGLVVSDDKKLIVVIYIVTAFALFYVNSRAYFYLWISAPFLYAVLATQLSLRYVSYVLILGAAVYITIELIEYLSPSNRVFRLFLDTEHDTSLDYRSYLFQRGWEQIKDSPVFGNYNGFLEYGGKGDYIHNILSYWHQFGFLPFATLVVMIGIAARNIFIRKNMSVSLFVKLSFVLTVMGLLLSHSYQQHAIFFVLGLSINSHLIRKDKKYPMRIMR